MKKILIITLFTSLLFTSCVSKKEYTSLKDKLNGKEQELVDVKASLQKCNVELQKCLVAKTGSSTQSSALQEQILLLKNQIKSLENDKTAAIKQVESLTDLSQGASENIKTVIAQLSEKDKYINGIRDAMTKKDSLNLAV
ncbi:MAG TPA: hypothetical protein EYP87_03095, partial [Flavobacteriaceae bacterium]|nr:hypothetical protein [Flavobacteriaceae bacterium]